MIQLPARMMNKIILFWTPLMGDIFDRTTIISSTAVTCIACPHHTSLHLTTCTVDGTISGRIMLPAATLLLHLLPPPGYYSEHHIRTVAVLLLAKLDRRTE